MTIYERYKNKIQQEYESKLNSGEVSPEDADETLHWNLRNTDKMEAASQKNIMTKFKNYFILRWRLVSDDTQSCIFLFCFFFVLGVLLPLFVSIGELSAVRVFNSFILNVSAVCSFSLIFIIASLIFYSIKDGKAILTKGASIFCLIMLLGAVPDLMIWSGYGNTNINDLFEYRTYTENYYVIMSRSPQTVSDRKEYTLSAEIERREDSAGTTDEGRDLYELNYHINYLYFPDGGYLRFIYDNAYDNPELTSIELNTEHEVTDYKGDVYYITLTDQKSN